MNYIKLASCLSLGLLAATSGTYAQETGQKTRPDSESAVVSPVSSYEALLHDADALIKGGKPGDAYLLLEPLEFEHAGDVRFDYLIGIAALDSGRPDKATFAFERVLAMDPAFAAARLDMARAYYQLGDLQRARTEFLAVLKQNPSEATRANIRKYLDEIDAQKEGKRVRYSGYTEGGVGRDTNVNSATSQSQIFVDRFSAVATLDQSSVRAADNYYAVNAGGEINYEYDANWGIFAAGDLRKRGNDTHSEFDSLGLDARAGIMYETKDSRYRMGMLGGRYNLGAGHYSDTAGLKGEWRHVFNPGNQLNAFAQAVQYRYVDVAMQPNDFDQQAVGLGWLHVLADGKSSLSASVHYGTEKDVSKIISTASPNGGRTDGAKRFQGLRIGGQSSINDKTILYATTGIQTGAYDKTNYYFKRQRHDRLNDLTVGVNWKWDRLWTLRPQLSYLRNDSNIAIYGYDRKDVSLTVRRDFR